MPKNIKIFSGADSGVVFQRLRSKSDKVYFTLASSAGKSLKTILMGSAPAVSMKVTEAVDYDMHKALNGGFLVASFGYAPIQIDIQGIDIWNPTKGCNSKLSGDIKGWWDKYNLHADPNTRIRLGITTASGNASYDCITTNLVRSVQAANTTLGSYALNIIGVRL